jgi:hypothetical protein
LISTLKPAELALAWMSCAACDRERSDHDRRIVVSRLRRECGCVIDGIGRAPRSAFGRDCVVGRCEDLAGFG